jgi:DNA-binding NarL/FixJ family response regulator
VAAETKQDHRQSERAGAGEHLLSIGVIDTVPLYRDGLTALVERTPWARLAAHSASQHGAMLMIEQVRPELVLLDSCLDAFGQFTQKLARNAHKPRVVLLVRDSDLNPRYVANSMASGAHAAVPRSAEPQRVLEAIRHARRAVRYLDPALTSLVTEHDKAQAPPLAAHAREGAQPSPPMPGSSPLSRREFQVMQLIAEGMENAAIAKVLFLSVETVRTHVKSILRKLAARDRTHAVTIGFRTGLLPLTPPRPGSGAHGNG